LLLAVCPTLLAMPLPENFRLQTCARLLIAINSPTDLNERLSFLASHFRSSTPCANSHFSRVLELVSLSKCDAPALERPRRRDD
jgi:hypothetical protein